MITVVYFWRIRKAFLPIAIINMAVNKLLLRVKFKKSFIKLLGTGKGESFTPKDADQFRWGLLITIDQSLVLVWLGPSPITIQYHWWLQPDAVPQFLLV